jgi:hypothetical protein
MAGRKKAPKRATKKRRGRQRVRESAPPPPATNEEVNQHLTSAPTPTGVKAAQSYTVQIRYLVNGVLKTMDFTTSDRSLYPMTQKWRYVVANRRRITRASQDSLSEEIHTWMRTNFGIDTPNLESQIKDMSAAGLAEVRIPYSDEDVGWAARVFPWESALWLLTRPLRGEADDFAAIRFLDTSLQPSSKAPTSALLVPSGPGELNSYYNLDREIEMVQEALQPVRCSILKDPGRAELQAKIAQSSPSIVHLSGVDPLILQSWNLAELKPDQKDGFVLRGSPSGYDPVNPVDLAAILNAGQTKPLLVAFSTCYSSPRVAALAAVNGAQHTVGFSDTLTDADAMLFFSVFYRTWAQKWDILNAFTTARRQWTNPAAVQTTQPTGAALWSRRSLLEVPELAKAAPGRTGTGTTRTVTTATRATPADLKFRIELVQDKRLLPGEERRAARTSLNYSLLHNDRPPFSIFTVEKLKSGELPPVRIEVALEVGNEVCRCRFSENLPIGIVTQPLVDKIRLPLVAGLLRQCTESLRSNLYTRIECGDRLVLETSDRVTVLPADEWRDDGEDHRWLPSFVLPRDPAVLKVVSCAQRYLRTLLDDCSAGFDGYQQLAKDDANAAAVVDPQVQAIWAALQHDLPVSYINPPPSYTSQSQRLRTPTEIFRGNAATCIDLALLFASCLEFVGIYSVVFLISGHAFPGYWRSDKAWWGMKRFKFEKSDDTPTQDSAEWNDISKRAQSSAPKGQQEAWMFTGVDNLAELLGYVQKGTLVPFESTFVTGRRGFYQSLETGSSNLHPQTFDAMIDIQSARGERVTPLPLLDRLV